MIFRSTAAFLLVVLMTGACSQSREESVLPEVTTSTTTKLGRASEEITSNISVVTKIPKVEIPQTTTLSATTVPEVLLRNGVPMVGWDLTVESAEVVDAAVEACSEVLVTSIMAGCTAAVWEVCYSVMSDGDRLSDVAGPTNFEEPELNLALGLGDILCTEAYTAEVVELAMVLAAKYGDRYYSEDASLPFNRNPDYDLEDFEDDYFDPGIGLLVFAEGVKRDFIDFRMYVGRREWDPRRAIDFGPSRFISDEAHVRIDTLFETLAEFKSVFSDSSSGTFEGFDAEKVIAFYAADSDNAQRVVDLPEDPEEVKLFCDKAAYAARLRRPNWVNGVNDCVMAVEDCVNKFVEVQHDICTNRLLFDTRLELMWKKLPAICAVAEDVGEESYDDSCRRSVLDSHMIRMGPLIDADALVNQIDDRLQYYWTRIFVGQVKEATFFLAQPLIADLPIEYRRFYSLRGP